MRRAQGMTLIEVLASIVILSTMTVAVVPLLTDALRSIDDGEIDPTTVVFELAELSDQIVADADAYALALMPAAGMTVPWRQGGREPVRVYRRARALETTAEAGPGDPTATDTLGQGWLVFEWRGLAVSRWIGDGGSGGRRR